MRHTDDPDALMRMVAIEIETMECSEGMKTLVSKMLSVDPAERPIADNLKLVAASRLREDIQ